VFKTQKLNTTYQNEAQSPLSGKQGGASAAQMRPLLGEQRYTCSMNITS